MVAVNQYTSPRLKSDFQYNFHNPFDNSCSNSNTKQATRTKIMYHDSSMKFEYNSGINRNKTNMFLYVQKIINCVSICLGYIKYCKWLLSLHLHTWPWGQCPDVVTRMSEGYRMPGGPIGLSTEPRSTIFSIVSLIEPFQILLYLDGAYIVQ